MEAHNKVAECKKDMRRKTLIGAYYLNKARKEQTIDQLKKTLDSYLTRNSDRSLFDLPDSAKIGKNGTTE